MKGVTIILWDLPFYFFKDLIIGSNRSIISAKRGNFPIEIILLFFKFIFLSKVKIKQLKQIFNIYNFKIIYILKQELHFKSHKIFFIFSK